MKQYIKWTRLISCFSIFFLFVMTLSFVTTQKTLKPSEKMFQCPGWMRKTIILGNFSWKVAVETWDASCSKKGLLEKQQVFQTFVLCYITIENDSLSELNRCIFQISLKYIQLVIPEILFILVLCSFNCYLKIMWPRQQNYPPPQ